MTFRVLVRKVLTSNQEQGKRNRHGHGCDRRYLARMEATSKQHIHS